jgi:hypothetical protein
LLQLFTKRRFNLFEERLAIGVLWVVLRSQPDQLLRLAEQSFEDAAKILMLGIAEEIVVIYPTTWIVSVGAD